LTRPIRELSKGYRQRVGIAQSILHLPRVLILDEPTAGLDPTQVIEIRKLIKELTVTSTILLSTHILSEVEAICDRVIVLVNGKVAADIVISELVKKTYYKLLIKGRVEEAKTSLKAISGVDQVILDSNHSNASETLFEIHYSEDSDIREAINKTVQSNGWSLLELSSSSKTLEQFFSELVGYSSNNSQSSLESIGIDEVK
jgi:ABC-2 type transport system ATP-binding protein